MPVPAQLVFAPHLAVIATLLQEILSVSFSLSLSLCLTHSLRLGSSRTGVVGAAYRHNQLSGRTGAGPIVDWRSGLVPLGAQCQAATPMGRDDDDERPRPNEPA